MSDPGPLEIRLHALMQASLAGDAAAYRLLLSELTRHLRSYYLKRLGSSGATQAEDLVQDTLMAIHTRRITYDPARPFTAWFYAIARYKLIDHYRHNRIRTHVPINDMDFADDTSEESVTARRDIAQALETLPEGQRKLIARVKLEGQSIADTAAETGLSESAVKVGIHRGLKALTARFGGGQSDDR
jgi:RNA polymerase sigma-70 factor (ECF subfamily)